jgi:hypothetical protein
MHGFHTAQKITWVRWKFENPSIVAVRDDGDNHLQARNIRNSISLTLRRSHRIIPALN